MAGFNIKRKHIMWCSLTFLFAVVTAWAVWCFLLNNNFHTVVDGQVYRSAQMSPAQIAYYKSRYHIRSIINLRGENIGKAWYDRETSTAEQLHINHIDFRMSAHQLLMPEQALQLIALMRDAPKPLLIHCMSGADRTSLAAALYIAAIEKGSEFQAEEQLSIFYGHIPFRFSRSYAMTDSFEDLEPLFGYNS